MHRWGSRFVCLWWSGSWTRLLLLFLVLILGIHHFHITGHVVCIGLVLCHQIHVLLLGYGIYSWLRWPLVASFDPMKGGGRGEMFVWRWAQPCRLAVRLGVFENCEQNPPWEVPIAWFLGKSFLDMASCSIPTNGATYWYRFVGRRVSGLSRCLKAVF